MNSRPTFNRNLPCRKWLLPCATLLVTLAGTPLLHADETLRRVQEELRKRHLYFGDIDGRNSDAVNAALKRYQLHKGFRESGLPDEDTLGSLGIAVASADHSAPSEGTWPEVPVLRSEAAREQPTNDHAFLEPKDPPWEPIPETLPEPVGENTAENKSTSGKETVAKQAPPARRPAAASTDTREADRVAQAKSLVRAYLSAAADDDSTSELGYYANKVDYFDHGTVGSDFIRKDVARYRDRWPQRQYTLLGINAKPSPDDPDEVEVRFRISFAVANNKSSVKGKTDNIFRVSSADGHPRLVSMREKRVRQ